MELREESRHSWTGLMVIGHFHKQLWKAFNALAVLPHKKLTHFPIKRRQFHTEEIIMVDLPLPDHVADLLEDESVHQEPTPIILHHAPAKLEGYVGNDDMEEDKEEDPDEDPKE
ncbi:hypothetical protein Tco_0321802 [Tanacetum coccineum]